jgi:hypothetical protein
VYFSYVIFMYLCFLLFIRTTVGWQRYGWMNVRNTYIREDYIIIILILVTSANRRNFERNVTVNLSGGLWKMWLLTYRRYIHPLNHQTLLKERYVTVFNYCTCVQFSFFPSRCCLLYAQSFRSDSQQTFSLSCGVLLPLILH